MKVEEKLNIVQKDYRKAKIRMNELEEVKALLENEESIIKYLLVTSELLELRDKENELTNEIQTLRIKLCDKKYGGHFYVIDRPKKKEYWDNETIVTCIHCGEKTNIMEHIDVKIDTRNCLDPVTQNLLINVHGIYVDDELEEVKKLYDKFKEEYPDATDDVIEEQISLVKKIRGGKLC